MHCYDPPGTLILSRICSRSHNYDPWTYLFIPGHPSKKGSYDGSNHRFTQGHSPKHMVTLIEIMDLIKDILQKTVEITKIINFTKDDRVKQI
jgi:hypothetical protein